MELTSDQALQQGVAAHKAGKLQDAERLYRAILQSQPAHPDANHNLGVLAVSVNKTDMALPLFETALEANPKIEQFWLSYIDALIKEKQFEIAKGVLEQGKKEGLAGDKVDSLERKLNAFFVNIKNIESSSDELIPAIKFRESGKFQEAQQWLQKFIESQPNHAEAFSLLCHVLLLYKKDVEAEQALIKATSINSELASIYRNQARLLLKQSKPEGALKKAQIAYERSVNNPQSCLVLASCLNANQRSKEALDLTENILLSNPNYAEAYATKALIRFLSNDIIGAITDADKAVSLKPHLTQIWVLLGSMHYKNKNLPDAIKAMETALQLEPANDNYMSTLGEFFRQDNRALESISILEKAVELAPKNISIWINLGAAFQQDERTDDAKVAYEKGLAINPNSAEISNNLGAIAKNVGDWESALQHFTNALKINPAIAKAHSNLGVALKELGRLEESEASFIQALALMPDYPEAHCNLGAALQELGRFKEAEANFRQAIVLKADYADAHSRLGVNFAIKEDYDSALDSIRRASDIEPMNRKFIVLKKILTSRRSHKQHGTGLCGVGSSIFEMKLNFNPLILRRAVEPELVANLYEINTKELDEKPDSRFGNGKATGYSLFEDNKFIMETVVEDLMDIMKESVKSNVVIFESFFNIFRAGSGITVHNHLGPLDKFQGFNLYKQKYVLQYYLRVGDQNCSEPGVYKLYEPEEEILPSEGTIIIIPAERMHSAVYGGKTDRVMIGVNFYSL